MEPFQNTQRMCSILIEQFQNSGYGMVTGKTGLREEFGSCETAKLTETACECTLNATVVESGRRVSEVVDWSRQ